MSGKSIAIKRINKDIKEINKSPIEGIGIISLGNNPKEYIVNIKLMEGPYKDYCIQLLLTFPDDYPSKPPKILIYPNQAIDGQYHHHIFIDSKEDENGNKFKKFCFDLLDNDFMSTKDENTGWNPSYTISSLLLQVQSFLCDPDMHGYIPNKNKIDQLMNSMKNYQREFEIINDKGENEIITHTWSNPYPEMYFKKENEKNDEKKEENTQKDEKNEKEMIRIQQIKENLTCFLQRLNYIDDQDICLGYPIIKSKAQYGNKLELYPIPELLTYDGFTSQIARQDAKLDYYFDIKFKSANNQYYNYWLPIYIDENHYTKNKTTILNSFSVIKYGAEGKKQYDFKPDHIFEVLPNILCKMIIGIYNGKVKISSAFIMCYFQYVLLFKKLCLEFEEEYCKHVNHILTLIKNNKYDANRKIVPDIGILFMLLFFSNKDTSSEKMKKIWYTLFEESSIRKSYWTFHEDEMRYHMTRLFFKDRKPFIDDVCLKRFEDDPGYDIMGQDQFIEELKDKKIYDKIVDIINSDDNFKSITKYNFNNLRFLSDYYLEQFDNLFKSEVTDSEEKKELIKEKIDKSFKDVYMQCSIFARKKIYALIIDKMKFSLYFDTKDDYMFKYYEEKTAIRNRKYDCCQVDEFLKDPKIKNKDEILKFAFDNQKGNKLLIITFLTKKKIEDKEFMKELEHNYGVYLDVDTFIKEMNQKLKEIECLSDMYNFIGSEFGQDEDDLDIVIKSYQKAKLKGYLRDPYSLPSYHRGGYKRGRGNFIGNRGGRGICRGGRGKKRGF